MDSSVSPSPPAQPQPIPCSRPRPTVFDRKQPIRCSPLDQAYILASGRPPLPQKGVQHRLMAVPGPQISLIFSPKGIRHSVTAVPDPKICLTSRRTAQFATFRRLGGSAVLETQLVGRLDGSPRSAWHSAFGILQNKKQLSPTQQGRSHLPPLGSAGGERLYAC